MTNGSGRNITAVWRFMRRQALPVMIGIMACILVAGCGYHFSGGGENIDRSIRNVFVEAFVNGTSEANIENTFRSSFIDQFIRSGRFKLVESREAADAVFKGNIRTLMTTPLSRTTGSLAAEERLTVTLELLFEASGDKKAIWLNKSFSGTGDYLVDATNASATEMRRKSALVKLADDTADRAYSMMMSGF